MTPTAATTNGQWLKASPNRAAGAKIKAQIADDPIAVQVHDIPAGTPLTPTLEE